MFVRTGRACTERDHLMPFTKVLQLNCYVHTVVWGKCGFFQIALVGGELRGHFVPKKVIQHLQCYQRNAMTTCFSWRGKKTYSIGTIREQTKVEKYSCLEREASWI